MLIPLDNTEKPLFNWFMAYSHMLAPNDQAMQKKIYHYRLLRYVLGNPSRAKKFFNKKKAKKTIPDFRKVLSDQKLRSEVLRRRKNAKRIGEIVRILHAMTILNIEDASLGKAYFLSKVKFKDQELDGLKDHSFSTKHYGKCIKQFNSTLNLCAAYTMMNPDNKRIGIPKGDRIKYFFAKSAQFAEFLVHFEYTRQGKNKWDKKSLLKGPLHTFPEAFELPQTAKNIEDAKFLTKVIFYLFGYSSDWKMNPYNLTE